MRGAVDLSALRSRPAAPAPGAEAPAGGAPTASVPSLVLDVTDATFGQVLELSRTVPIVVDLWAEWCGPCKQLSPILEKVVLELGGRLVLAKVDVDANPQLAQGFRAQSIPMVVALVAGQPVPMFTGAVPEQQVREVFAQLLQVAAQNGVTGTVTVAGDIPAEAPAEPALPPLHAEAYDAIEAGDYPRAIRAYEQAIAENPRDADARAGLGQVRLLDRVQGLDLQEARA
ncbi:MAG TPA: thioredoxin domain-containing protein, partial [Microbacterium sp.]|nr:thioredoxin domain-containing protein [Microbacterium sp.]